MAPLAQLAEKVEDLDDRLTRLEEQVLGRNTADDTRFATTDGRNDSRFSNLWRAVIGLALIDFALIVWAVSQGFDLATIAPALG